MLLAQMMLAHYEKWGMPSTEQIQDMAIKATRLTQAAKAAEILDPRYRDGC